MCLYENDPNEIHMLIGADFAGRLLTGEIKQITENLVAIHTRLGWTLMGESGENTRRCETLLSLHVSDLNISELWRLDTIGATIEFHLKNAPDHYKETAHTLLESFYVDNLVCSVNSKEKLDKLIVESQEILKKSVGHSKSSGIANYRHLFGKIPKWKDQLDRLKAIAVPRSENENSASCQLVQARSRVAPLKSISIPRLELLACTIGARLARTVKEDLKLPSLPVFFIGQIQLTLSIDKEIGELGCFCIKQSQEIRNLSNPDDWYYVPGSKNPADLPSRGCSVDVWQNQNGGKAPIGSEVLQKTGRSKKFILTLKSLTLKKKDSHFRHQFGDKQI
ncbi:DUF1758 domain-containing protein [Trichonephila clavipes]|nr:DUF1758 domain-containing protein [Trichonephila clavipes]